MRLAVRLVLSSGILSLVSAAGLGAWLRKDRAEDETLRFRTEVERACARIEEALTEQVERDTRLMTGACRSGGLVGRVQHQMARGDLERAPLAEQVRLERDALGLSELLLATDSGELLAADPPSVLRTPKREIERLLKEDGVSVRKTGELSLLSRCVARGVSGRAVGLVGWRQVRPILDRMEKNLSVSIAQAPATSVADVTYKTCTWGGSEPLTLSVSKPNTELVRAQKRIDERTFVAAMCAFGASLVLSFFLARGLSRPLSELNAQAKKVAAGEARPLPLRGPTEMLELSESFNRMLGDLAQTRRRLSAVSRVAAWQEVARRVAHEIKNPLAPIRAAVETLRRLFARNDVAFSEYFDEATRTVLEEVHRISNIITEFTRFARLPAPNPEPIDLLEVAHTVVSRERPVAAPLPIEIGGNEKVPVLADRDQVVQVLTNLIQNAVDATRDRAGGLVKVRVFAPFGAGVVEVSDNGSGISPALGDRLFEPYATTKVHGTGLGLAIAQRIAMEHGGDLTLEQGEVGATFRLTLPAEGPPSQRRPHKRV